MPKDYITHNLECSPISLDWYCDDFSKTAEVLKLVKVSGYDVTILLNCPAGTFCAQDINVYRNFTLFYASNFIIWFDVTMGGLHKYHILSTSWRWFLFGGWFLIIGFDVFKASDGRSFSSPAWLSINKSKSKAAMCLYACPKLQ